MSTPFSPVAMRIDLLTALHPLFLIHPICEFCAGFGPGRLRQEHAGESLGRVVEAAVCLAVAGRRGR